MLFKDSSRVQHFLYAIPASFIGTIFISVGLACGMELKDKVYTDCWDWGDWIATVLGGVIGQALQLLTIYYIIK